MSQILDDLKKGFKVVDEFYTNKIREPVVNMIKSYKKVLKFAKDDVILHDNNEYIIKTASELNEHVPNHVSAVEDLTEKYHLSIGDNDIL